MTFYENAFDAEPGLVLRGITDRQNLLRHETEDFLRMRSLDYELRRREYWRRDYSSEEAFLASVEDNRARWLAAMGDFGPPDDNMDPLVEPFAENEHFRAEWVTVNLYGNLRGRGVFAVPKAGDGPFPTVICQHGIGSSPEKTFGFDDGGGIYHAYAQRCLEAGFAVIAPMNITEGPPRARYTRLCTMLGKTLWGLWSCVSRPGSCARGSITDCARWWSMTRATRASSPPPRSTSSSPAGCASSPTATSSH